jgi:hypothetical protein
MSGRLNKMSGGARTGRKPGPKPVSVGTIAFGVLGVLSQSEPRSLNEIYASLKRDYSDPSMIDLLPGTRRRMERHLWELKRHGYADTVSGRRSHWISTPGGSQAIEDACTRFDEGG